MGIIIEMTSGKNHLKVALLIIWVLSMIAQIAQADELWVKEKPRTRIYFKLTQNDRNIQVKKYSQSKGDYQEHLETKSFSNLKAAHDFLNSLANYRQVYALTPWSIDTDGSEEIVDKGIFGTSKKNAYIWETKNQWSEAWEAKYAEWIQKNVDTSFYQKYKIPTDCADALVGLRWIFSRINNLPVANTIADTGELFGNFSMPKKWQKLSTATEWYNDELFMTALDFIMDLTSTRTVINDGYPVKIDRTGLIAGAYIITQHDSLGHAKIISETHYDEVTELPFYTLASTTPRSVRLLIKETFVDQEWPLHKTKDVLAFRWPILKNSTWSLKPSSEHPRYSLDQYNLEFKKVYPAFISFILSRVKDNYDPVKLVELGTNEITNYANLRIDIVNAGYKVCHNNACKAGDDNYEAWSTTSRDEKLLKKFSDMDQLVKEFESISPGLYEFWVNQLRNTSITVNGNEISLSSMRYLFEHHFTSDNPNLTPKERWGLDTGKTLNNWMGKVETLLDRRAEVISTLEAPCTGDCFPKSDKWFIGNTYQIDSTLNSLYADVTSYCHVVGKDNCKQTLAFIAPSIINHAGIEKSLADWFEMIPFFHSDPRVDLKRRWGVVSGSLQGVILPYFEKIKIAKNSLAVLDEKKLIDLKKNHLLYEAAKDTRLALSDGGAIYLISDTLGTISLGIVFDNAVTFKEVSDPQNVLTDFKNRKIFYSEENSQGIFRKAIPNGILVFRIKEGVVEFINKYSGQSMQVDSLLSMVHNLTTISLADLEKHKLFEFDLPLSEKFKDMNKMKILSYSYPIVLMEYVDQDWGLHYPLRVNLETSLWEILDLGLHDPFEIRWASVKAGKAFVSAKINDEFPELYAVDFRENKIVMTRLENNFLGATQVDDHVYFIQSKGSQWSQGLNNKLMDWADSVQVSALNYLGNPTFLNNLGVYFTNKDNGAFATFQESRIIKMPKALISPDDFYNLQVGVQEMLSYRFDTSYGDYWRMGGILNLKSNLSNEELSLDIPLYAWINKGDLIQERWQQSFISSNVYSGTLVGLGINLGMWWGPTE
jgi:hypothetical protein